MVKLVYTPVLGTGASRRGGSSPLLGTFDNSEIGPPPSQAELAQALWAGRHACSICLPAVEQVPKGVRVLRPRRTRLGREVSPSAHIYMTNIEGDKKMRDIQAFAVEMAGQAGTLPSLDLHGMYPSEVETVVDQFLNSHYPSDVGVEIIFGHGEGKLREAVKKYLLGETSKRNKKVLRPKHPMVLDVIEKSGACYVVFDKYT